MKKILSAILLTLPLMFSGCWEVSSGEKIGQIIAISEQGVFVKTWEAQIVRGGMNNGSGVTGQVTHFTIENNPALVEALTKAMNEGKEVKIRFKTEMVSFLRSDSGNVFAQSMEIIEPVGMKIQESKLKTVDAHIKTNKISDSDLTALTSALNNIINKK